MPGKGYVVQILLYTFEYCKFCPNGIEYDDFVRVAKANGFEVSIARTDLLINPKAVTVDITSPGQWALYEMLGSDTSEDQAMVLLRKYDCPGCNHKAA